jgi:hypothetical protein
MSERKPKPAGFVGCVEVLTRLHEFKEVDHWTVSRLIGAPSRDTVRVFRRCVRLGWVKCLQEPARGRWGPPGRYAITLAGRRRIGREHEAGSRERGAGKDAETRRRGDAERSGKGNKNRKTGKDNHEQ